MAGLDTRLREVVGGPTAKAFNEVFDLYTVGELLAHYPRRYVDRADLRDLQVGEHATVLAKVAEAKARPMRNRPGWLFEVIVTDGTGRLKLTFFPKKRNHLAWLERDLYRGRRGLFDGKVTEFNRVLQLTYPKYNLLGADGDEAAGGVLIPIYPATASMSSWDIAKAVRIALDVLDAPLDPLPAQLRERERLPSLVDALHGIHQPTDRTEVRRATQRLKWDEAFVLQVTLAQRRAAATATPATARVARPDGLLAAFEARLPFALTAGQRQVGAVIAAELARPHPMHRLLQGEVGSGKTVVALCAMLTVIDAGGQAALLAPTEVLAQQHARSLADLLGPLGAAGQLDGADGATRIALLTGSLGVRDRRAALADIESGAAGLVIGTHALLEQEVAFRDLGLVVVDEQHRFGVEQRDALRAKGGQPPHVLVMTATPIPRTVAMTVYGDLETSTLTELPVGRKQAQTSVVPADKPRWMAAMWERVRTEVTAGRQGFVVCPRIGGDESEENLPTDDEGGRAVAVLDVAPTLVEGELRGLRVGVLHGRLPPEDKDSTMRAFATGQLDVLVATTVIEVGIDVPNATVMVVLDATRFGVSQLHQLRGRVGRGGASGWCLLHTAAPADTPGRARLDAVAKTADGFELARLDLEQRREGDVLGTTQHGRRSQLKLLRLLADEELIVAARKEATALVAADPQLAEHPALAAAIAARLDEEHADYLGKA